MQLNLQPEMIISLLPARLFVEPTLACNVGCAFCKYSAKSSSSQSNYRLPDTAIEGIRAYSSAHPLQELVITGGGEPTYEMDLVMRLLHDISAGQATIYTAAQWAETSDSAVEMISALERVCRSVERPLTIRLSIDTFHARTLGDDVLHNVIAAASMLDHDKDHGPISYGIRAVIGQEPYLEALIRREGGIVTKASASTGSAILPTAHDDFDIPVLFKGIVPLGRMKPQRAAKLHVLSPEQLRMSYAQELGTGWPITYKGGWNAGVRWSGDVYLYGGSPVEYGNLKTGMPLLDAFYRMAADPINYLAAATGFATLYELFHKSGLLNDSLINVLHDPSLYLPIGLADAQLHSKAQAAAFEYLSRDTSNGAKIVSDSRPSRICEDCPTPLLWEQRAPGPVVTAHAVEVALGDYKGRGGK
jgi:Radical SAM superfamily/4Fe-4S single cluster domain